MDEIRFIQLEPAAFLTDIDFQMMTAEERGVYCSIIFYLYCNSGTLQLVDNTDITLLHNNNIKLAVISGCHKTGSEWVQLWSKISHKFKITNNILSHKRVTEELKKIEEYRKRKSEAGKKGMQTRWGDNTLITKISKDKISKDKKDIYSSDFESFWSAYPKKIGKGKAAESWTKLAPSMTLRAVIQRAVEQQSGSLQWKKKRGEFIPLPATWLNQKRWDDELDYGNDEALKKAFEEVF